MTTPGPMAYPAFLIKLVDKRPAGRAFVVKWELDLWYELWERAGSQGLDTWYDPREAGGEDRALPPLDAGDATGESEGA